MSKIVRSSGCILKASSLFSVMLFIATSAFASAIPAITTATVDTVANTLTLSGVSLLGPDGAGVSSFTLISATGTTTQLTMLNASATSLVGGFPAASPASSLTSGAYTVHVKFFTNSAGEVNSAQFTLTVGGQGPGQQPPNTPPVSSGQTTLVFQYVTNTPVTTTSIAISNLSTIIPSSTSLANPSTCNVTFFGSASGLNATGVFASSFSTGQILPGNVYTNNLAGEAPSFQGYVAAVCNFKALGVEFITPVGASGPSYAIPAVVNP